MPCFLAGSEIIRCDPYSWCVRTGRLNDVCSFCFKQKKDRQPCNKCSIINYCNEKCRENDYVNHRLECVILTLAKGTLDSPTRFCIRTLTRKKWENTMCQVSRGRIFGKRFSDLFAHLWEGDYDARLGNAKQIYGMLKCRMEVTLREVLICLLKLHVHSIPVEDYKGTSLGRAIYLDQSVLEHSCEAESTVSCFFDGKTFIMRALKNFRVCSLAKVRMSFVSRSAPVRMRQALLTRDYYIQCKCSLCLDELRKSREETSVERRVRRTLSAKNISTRRKLKLMLEVLPKCDSTLHPYYLSQIYRSLAIGCNSLQRHDEAICYASKALVHEEDARFKTAILEELLFAMSELGWNHIKGSQFELFLSTLQSHKRLLETRLGKEHKESDRIRKSYLLYLTRSFVCNKASSTFDAICHKLISISGRLLLVARVAVKGEDGLADKHTAACENSERFR